MTIRNQATYINPAVVWWTSLSFIVQLPGQRLELCGEVPPWHSITHCTAYEERNHVHLLNIDLSLDKLAKSCFFTWCVNKRTMRLLESFTPDTILLCHHSDTPNPCPTVHEYAKLVFHRGPEFQQLSPLTLDNLESVVMCDNLWLLGCKWHAQIMYKWHGSECLVVIHGAATKNDVNINCVWVDVRSNVVT